MCCFVNLGDTLQSIVATRMEVRAVETATNLIIFIADDVELVSTAVIDRLKTFDAFWRPRIRRSKVLVVSWLLHHLVEETLEGLLGFRWLRADCIGGVGWKSLRLDSKDAAIESSISIQAKFIGAFSCSIWDLTSRNSSILIIANSFAYSIGSIVINTRLFHDLTLIYSLWIHPRVASLGFKETLVRSHRWIFIGETSLVTTWHLYKI